MGDQILHFDEARRLHLDVAADVRVLGDDGEPVVDDDGRPVKERKHWQLDDDFPAEGVFGLFRLVNERRAEVAALDTPPPDDVDAGFALAQVIFDTEVGVYLDALLRIWRHSYPRTTADDLRHWFDHRQRKELVEAFFSLLGVSSSPLAPTPPDGTPTLTGSTPKSSPMSQTTTASPTGETTAARTMTERTGPNRATRRAAVRTRKAV